MKNRPEELYTLKKEIEESAGFTIESKADFKKLHFWLDRKLKEINEQQLGTDEKGNLIVEEYTPSADTLMRIWEYVKYDGEISTKTWGFLVRSIGYLGWDDFKEKVAESYSPPVPTHKEVFDNQRKIIKEQSNGDGIYLLGWYPKKYSK
ncbi:MAG: hypothetical protein ACK5LL_07250 [Suipraeoptans sp.]